MMYRVVGLLLLMFAPLSSLSASDAWDEYGDPSEMKGLTKIYVDTGEYLEVRKLVIEELKKAIPNVVVTAGSDDAELALIFVPRLVNGGDDTRTTLYVLRPVAEKVRLLDRYEDWSTHTGTTGFARTSRVVTRKFVAAYRKANGV